MRFQPWLADLRFALRLAARHPVTSAVAVVILALAVAANVTVWSVLRAALGEPLAYPDPEQLVMLWESAPDAGFVEMPFSPPDVLELAGDEKLSEVLRGVAAFELMDISLESVHGAESVHSAESESAREGALLRPERLHGVAVSPELFQLLRTTPVAGELPGAGWGGPGASRRVLLGYGFWQRRFAGDPEVIGQRLWLDGLPHVVGGVLPDGFAFPFPITWQGRLFDPRKPTDVYLPLRLESLAPRGEHRLMMLGRLRDEVSASEVEDVLAARLEKLAADHPASHPPDLGARVVPATWQATAGIRPQLHLLTIAVSLLLALAAVNVASLLVARSMTRAKEMAVRAACGAGGGALGRLAMVESLGLGLVGAALGLVGASWAVPLLARLEIDGMPRLESARLDFPLVLAAAGMALFVSIMMGMVSWKLALRRDLSRTLAAHGRSAQAGPMRGPLLRRLVLAEVALATGLATVALWTTAGLRALDHGDPGFDASLATVVELAFPPSVGDAEQARRALGIAEAARAVEGVEAAGVGSFVPLGGRESSVRYSVEPRFSWPPDAVRVAAVRHVGRHFLEALGVGLIAGRWLEAGDTAKRGILVDEGLAGLEWPPGEALGQRLTFDDPGRRDAAWWTVVGVVEQVRARRLEAPAQPALYLPLSSTDPQHPAAEDMVLVARSQAERSAALAEAVWRVEPSLPAAPRRLEVWVEDAMGRWRLSATLLGLFAAVALLLAGSGVYGVLAFVTEQRGHELAVRAAVGASPAELGRWIERQASSLALRGAGLGVVVALGLWVGSSELFTAPARVELGLLVATIAGIWGIARLAVASPARRARRIDAAATLRAE